MSWRLYGQEEYLKGKKFLKINILEYKNKIERPLYFHEHCDFCFDYIEDLDESYCTKDFNTWVCPTCFNDFYERFDFKYCKYNYFKLIHEIEGTFYHEFKLGKYEGKHWNDKSLYIDDGKIQSIGLFKIFEDNINNYNYFGPTKINYKQWEKVLDSCKNYSDDVQNSIYEIKEWVEYSLAKYKCFTMLGI